MKHQLARKQQTARERYLETLRGMEPDKVLTERINELERKPPSSSPAERDGRAARV